MAIPVTAGKFPLALLPILASVLAGGTIITCYILAVNEGHVEAWPNTDITHCAKYAPESYIFRVGIITSSVFLIVGYVLINQWIKGQEAMNDGVAPRSHCFISLTAAACVAGVVGAVCLIVSSAVIEPSGTPWTLHIVFAIIFFACTAAAQVVFTFKLCLLYNEDSETSLTSVWSLALKVLLNGCTGVFLALFVGADLLKSHGILDPIATTQLKNAMEWFLVADILLYSLTLSIDWRGKVYESLVIPVVGGPMYP
eukprot:TRINITY_DN1712_c0_g1_i2.p1 TRINITY_DN1712_c0_g1~~TRINITY_DN1712_c0_g1_i2.p1  ORF type:complete len:294 (-),score=85.14 TRINITY_DN1712_c0_g1_i2:428-1192(-)